MSRLPLRLLLLLAVCLAQPTAAAAPQEFVIDPVHTRVAFQVSHAGFSNPIGSFSGAQGELRFDPDDWSTAEVRVRIPIASLDLGDGEWRKRILDRTFFDAERFPEARFRSLRVERIDAIRGMLHGELSLHGVTRPLSLDFTFNALKRHPLTFKRTAGFSASGTLRRSEFGMNAWKHLVGDEVRLIIEAEAVRGHGDNDDDTSEATHADTQ
jgi:polyisoprenoid-binding protein YceI